MSGITIIPGTFNPPATPAQVMAVYAFPRKPDVTLRKANLSYQFGPRRGGSAPPPLAMPNIVEMQRDYFDGDCQAVVAGEPIPDTTAVTLVSGRYIPNGTYPVTIVDGGGTVGYFLDVDPWERTTGTMAMGNVAMPWYFVTGTGYRAFLVMHLNYAVALEAADDGAEYVVRAKNQDFGGWVTGDSGTVEIQLSDYSAPSGGGVRPFDIEASIHLELLRDGELCDLIIVGLRITGGAVTGPIESAPVVGDVSAAVTYVEESGMNETLYGAVPFVPVITGPPLQIVSYFRSSIVLQGILTPS